MRNDKIFFRIIQIAAFCVFAGRAYQHLFWDAPFRTLLWNEGIMSGFVETVLQLSWSEYVRSEAVDIAVQNIIMGFGWFYLLMALVVVFVEYIPQWARKLLWLGSAALVFLAGLFMMEKFNHIGQFFEYTLQFGSPLFLYYLLPPSPLKGELHSRDNSIEINATKLDAEATNTSKNTELRSSFRGLGGNRFILLLKIAIALTFTCHGLYALNYYPRPGNFVQMTITILNCSEAFAHQFLQLMGILDFVVAVGIFLPNKWAKPFIIWAIIWGFGTTMARVYANFYIDFWQDSLHQWAWESLVRFPHWLLPVALLVENSWNAEAQKR